MRKILFPIMPIYYVAAWFRNWCFDIGIIASRAYNFPVICVGNLSTGGTGKSPMIEYLIRMLKPKYNIATLSRGYKRKTTGFFIADDNSSAAAIGDEPMQFYRKFKDVLVSIDEDRQNGISKLRELTNPPEIILLDDAFQHRKVKAGLNILLSAYDNLYKDDFVLPTGNLREPRSGAKRAHIIVVTKCPNKLDERKKIAITNKLKTDSTQNVFFSTIKYSESIFSSKESKPLKSLITEKFTLVTGIANPAPLLSYLNTHGFNYEHLNFKDHHDFKESEIKLLNSKSTILTTEKDYTRLIDYLDEDKLFYLPIEMEISESKKFENLINKFLSAY